MQLGEGDHRDCRLGGQSGLLRARPLSLAMKTLVSSTSRQRQKRPKPEPCGPELNVRDMAIPDVVVVGAGVSGLSTGHPGGRGRGPGADRRGRAAVAHHVGGRDRHVRPGVPRSGRAHRRLGAGDRPAPRRVGRRRAGRGCAHRPGWPLHQPRSARRRRWPTRPRSSGRPIRPSCPPGSTSACGCGCPWSTCRSTCGTWRIVSSGSAGC